RRSAGTSHHVSEEVDGGDIYMQLKCHGVKEDTADSITEKVPALESKAWIAVIKTWDK
ncbi:phosphoribosylglycinamide formyltransferase, partial [Francisella tularensis subsp. holarctica]|uniref:formyltransferase family protein n=1 Tax=Francisella tularensis TaxID=263 RepID=UPI0023819845